MLLRVSLSTIIRLAVALLLDYPTSGLIGQLIFTRLLTLWKHADVEIKRHTLVKPDKSPYDGDWVYWSTRRGQDIEAPTRVAKLLKKHAW